MTLLLKARKNVTEKFKCFKLNMQRALEYMVFPLSCLYHPFLYSSQPTKIIIFAKQSYKITLAFLKQYDIQEIDCTKQYFRNEK